jgi:lysozyme
MCTTKDYIKSNEGLELKLYECTAGKNSIGYGRNIEDNGISKDEAELMLENDLEVCRNSLYNIFGFELFILLSDIRKTILTDMIYNLGATRFRTFKKMIKAVKEKDYFKASQEILDSKYARKDAPRRAKQNAMLMDD